VRVGFTESEVEEAALEWLESLGWAYRGGPEIAPGELFAERESYGQVILTGRLREAIKRLNPKIPEDAREEAFRKLTRTESPSLVVNNRTFHRMLVDGVPVEYRRKDGTIAGDHVRLIDFDNSDENDWLAVNQFTVTEGQYHRRPDVVLFVNGLPLGVIELKNPADENADVWKAYKQIQTYKQEIPSLFVFNECVVTSDGLDARIGTLTGEPEWFMPWRTVEGDELAASTAIQLEVLLRGVFEKRRFLDLIRHFIVFEDDGSGALAKVMAGYHQFHAVNKAVDTTLKATKAGGDRRCGVVWHTQGSGKSLTMAFYAGCLVVHRGMENPTLVVLTDRNDLDEQLFGTFSRCQELVRQAPIKAESRAHLRELLKVASGGVVFTTVQKFLPDEKGDSFPLLTDRRNVIVIADEAHRSQYDFIDGFARHLRDALPNASFIGFTGTPIELTDRNTKAVFGDYISIYDIQQAVTDHATVPIYYESRLAKLELSEAEKPHLDTDFEEVTEGEEEQKKERLKTKWAALEAVVGTEKRIGQIAADLVDHFEKRLEAMDGKALVVCMSRRIAVELYDALVKLRPAWHEQDDAKGAIKIVMTGSASDDLDWQQHIRNKPRREALAKRFKNPADPLKVVIVRDMWLTGFDAPCLHTMYVDKPMRGHGLMQAIARVNRVFRDKPGGLVVDYLGLADQLKQALADYTNSKGRGQPTHDQAEAVAVMLEKYEICCGILHGFDWSRWVAGKAAERIGLLPSAQEHVLSQEIGKERFMNAVAALSAAFALAVPHAETIRIRDDVAFFQAVRSALVKSTGGPGGARPPDDLDAAIRQLVSRAISPGGVIDIFAAAGLTKPDISILSDSFLAEVRDLPHKNLAVELLRKLLNDEITVRSKKNFVQARSFAEMLEKAIRKYQNRAIETAQIIEELIELAKDVREAGRRGEDLGLSDDEVAFYDALEVNDSAVKVLGDETLKTIAKELVETVRRNVTIDWTIKESARARLRVIVKRILRKYGYPPDKQASATETVLKQAELIGAMWAEEPPKPEPFVRVLPGQARYPEDVPLLTLKIAAGGFSETQEIEVDDWVRPATKRDLRKGMFVARVEGHSMEPMIPDDSWCLFASPVTGSRQGRIVLAQHRSIHDPETGGSYTVKRYKSQKTAGADGSWHHTRVILEPLNPAFNPIVIEDVDETEVAVVAELMEVLG
jgi:type I restriction enzyme R subunit